MDLLKNTKNVGFSFCCVFSGNCLLRKKALTTQGLLHYFQKTIAFWKFTFSCSKLITEDFFENPISIFVTKMFPHFPETRLVAVWYVIIRSKFNVLPLWNIPCLPWREEHFSQARPYNYLDSQKNLNLMVQNEVAKIVRPEKLTSWNIAGYDFLHLLPKILKFERTTAK